MLSACATHAPRLDNRAGGVELANIESWHAKGRLGVSSGEKGGSGSFVWDQENDRSTVQLSGPVGVGSVRLSLKGTALAIQTADGQKFESQAALDELRNRLGADVPVEKLRYWIVGLAAPGPHRWLNADTELEQDGWHITYQDYLEDSGMRLPTKVVASSGPARVRVLVDHWEVGPRG
jgi:outer membrane lipoprotein LolB